MWPSLRRYVLFVESKTRIYVAIIETLRWFAGKQIRDVAVSVSILAITTKNHTMSYCIMQGTFGLTG